MNDTKHFPMSLGLLLAALAAGPAAAEYPVQRPPRATPPAAESRIAVHPDRPKQLISGLGFEIQSDSINSGNQGMSEATTSVPHDLVPAERERFCREMLRGFRYCRLAGGLYWRGLDAEKKLHQARWPEQMDELRDMIAAAGIEGVEMEYWSPAPFWKANGKYTGKDKSDNVLRCFGRNFDADPVYHGDRARFLADFAAACRHDVEYLRAHGIPVAMWALQNEPACDTPYASCVYNAADYARTFGAVAPVIRAIDPKIRILADSWDLRFIAPVLKDPAQAPLVDALVIHHIGSDAKSVGPRVRELRAKYPTGGKPMLQNEYEYLGGPASPARCLNTVEHIVNWFQQGEAPTWFWIHALKPAQNSEASGYSLGFWRPPDDADDSRYPKGLRPGHWTWNPYNWNAVGSFVRHMPWDCRGVAVTEDAADDDLRVFAFKRPDGRLTVVLANRGGAAHTFRVETGLAGASFRGFRYTPDEAGADCRGVPQPARQGPLFAATVPDLAWEFWEQK